MTKTRTTGRTHRVFVVSKDDHSLNHAFFAAAEEVGISTCEAQRYVAAVCSSMETGTLAPQPLTIVPLETLAKAESATDDRLEYVIRDALIAQADYVRADRMSFVLENMPVELAAMLKECAQRLHRDEFSQLPLPIFANTAMP